MAHTSSLVIILYFRKVRIFCAIYNLESLGIDNNYLEIGGPLYKKYPCYSNHCPYHLESQNYENTFIEGKMSV